MSIKTFEGMLKYGSTRFELTLTCPRVGFNSPNIKELKVLLPAPLSPNIPTFSFLSILKFTPLRTEWFYYIQNEHFQIL